MSAERDLAICRFWSLVDRRSSEECWPWLGGSTSHFGYGGFRFGGRMHTTHRLAWIFSGGAIPAGMCVLHSCDNPPCVNPAHLFLGTRADNIRDMRSKGRAREDGWHRRGEEHWRAKLSERQVAEIKRRIAAGEVQRRLAAEYGVSTSTINFIAKGQRWSHVK